MVDVTSAGTLYVRSVNARRVTGGTTGTDPRTLTLEATAPAVPGNIEATLTYDGADNTLALTSTNGTSRVTGITAVASDDTDLPNKLYVDGLNLSAVSKRGVRVASTANIVGTYNNGTAGVGATLTAAVTAGTIDGIALIMGDRVLLKDQAPGFTNGIYEVISLAGGVVFRRTSDFDSPEKISSGPFCFVQEGTISGGKGYLQVATGNLTVGVSSLSFSLFSSGAPSIFTCTDAAIAAPAAGDLLTYDGVLSKWANRNLFQGKAKGATVAYTGTGYGYLTHPLADDRVLVTTTSAVNETGLLYDDIPAVLGRAFTAPGTLVARGTATGKFVAVPPTNDPWSVLHYDATSDTRLAYVNLYELMTRAKPDFLASLSLLDVFTPLPPAGVTLGGAAGSLIPMGSFINDPLAQVQYDLLGAFCSNGPENNTGIMFGYPGNLMTSGVNYYYTLDYSLTIQCDVAPVSPLTNAIVIVENYGEVSQLIYPQSACVFDFKDTGKIYLRSPTTRVSQTKETLKTYNVCLWVQNTGLNPQMQITGFTFTAQLEC